MSGTTGRDLLVAAVLAPNVKEEARLSSAFVKARLQRLTGE
jgi:hypothetical protein